MNWIRIATKMKGDPRMGALAAACRVRIEHAVGLVCCTLMEFPDHARNGDIAAVPDVVLEQWALWSGRPGVFAAAFREQLCDETGVVRAWERHNGAAIRRADEDLKRKRSMRGQPADVGVEPQGKARPVRSLSARQNADRLRKSDETPQSVGEVSSVDGTLRRTTSSADAADAVPRGGGGGVDDIAEALTEPHHRDAYLGFVRSARHPDALRAELRLVHEGLHAPGGRPVPWPVIGQALHELRLADGRLSATSLGAFVQRIVRRADDPTRDPATQPSWDDLIAREEAGANV